MGSYDREHLGQDELEVGPREMEIRPLMTMFEHVQNVTCEKKGIRFDTPHDVKQEWGVRRRGTDRKDMHQK